AGVRCPPDRNETQFMEKFARPPRDGTHPTHARWPRPATVACLLFIVLVLLRFFRATPVETLPPTDLQTRPAIASSNSEARDRLWARLPSHRAASELTNSPAEIVAGKVTQFGRSRRAIAHALADKYKTQVPPEAEQFFDAVEAGRWEDIDARFT